MGKLMFVLIWSIEFDGKYWMILKKNFTNETEKYRKPPFDPFENVSLYRT